MGHFRQSPPSRCGAWRNQSWSYGARRSGKLLRKSYRTKEISLVTRFRGAANACTSECGLKQLLGDVARELGFDCFALVAAVSMQRTAPYICRIDSYPECWTDQLIGQCLYVDDPILIACRSLAWGFSWDAVPSLIPMRSRQREILLAASRCGLRQGFTVPANIPFEPSGSCSFASRRSGPIAEWRRQAAELVGTTAIRTARRLHGWSRFPPQIHFSPREQEVLEWVAAGKSNTDIAAIMGIGLETVKTYVKAVIEKLGAADRTRAAVLAARLGVVLVDAAGEGMPTPPL